MVDASLNVGLSAERVVAAIMHCVPNVGFPRVLNAISVAKRVVGDHEYGAGVDGLPEKGS